MLNGASNAFESSVTVPPPSTGAFLAAIGADLHDAAARTGYSATHKQQVLISHHLDHGQAPLRDPPASHPAGTAQAFKHARGGRRGPDRTRSPDVVGTVRLRPALEVVALDRALEALTLGYARDLYVIAGRERVHSHRV